MWFGFQFNLSDSSDDDLYRLDFDPKGQVHQWKMISIQLGSYFGAPKKKLSRGCLKVRPDANANADADADADADANRSKTICRPPLKGVDIIGNHSQRVARSPYKRGVFTKSIPEEARTITVPSLSAL